MPIEESLTKNKVENPTAAIGKTSKKTLMCENEYSPGKAIEDGNAPCAIVSTAREIKRSPLKKL